MLHLPHYFSSIVLLALAELILGYLAYRIWKSLEARWRPLLAAAVVVVSMVLTLGASVGVIRIANAFPDALVLWTRAGAILLFGWLLLGVAITFAWDTADRFYPGRRRLLKAATFAAPLVVTAVGYAGREKLRVTNTRIAIPNLASGLQGLRLVLLSDLHMSPLVPRELVARAVAMANEMKAHIALVTGDLISRQGDPLDACLEELAELRADAGVYGCLGNHEIYARCQDYATRQGARQGLQFLRGAKRQLEFGGTKLNLAGVDYQSFRDPYLTGGEALIEPGMPNILLSHNPDVFPVAAKIGFDLTIAGHTHGGQVNVEILSTQLNLARFYTPYVAGKYQIGSASAYVTRGVGTIGLPIRLNSRPEVSVIELCAT